MRVVYLVVLLLFGFQIVGATQSDVNSDGRVDWHDYLLFVQAFKAGDFKGDLNQDGQLDQTDVALFAQAYGYQAQTAPSTKFAKLGQSRLILRKIGTTGSISTIEAKVGDIITVELFIEGREERLTGVEIFLEFDDQYLQLTPDTTVPELTPFRQGVFLRGTVFQNNTLGDFIGSSLNNNIPFFQLYYQEETPRNAEDGAQRSAVGDGVLATFKLRVIRSHPEKTTAVRVIRASPTGSETGYFKLEDPGSVYAFDMIRDLTIQTVNEGFVTSNFELLVTQNGLPVGGLQIEIAPFIAGQSLVYIDEGVTDSSGRNAGRVNSSGLYVFRARDLTRQEIVGQWHSVPLNANSFINLTLPIGAPFVVNEP